MNGSIFRVSYNSFSYRWEIWKSGARLPQSTHASRDAAVMIALHLIRDLRRARVVVFNDQGAPETVLDVQNAGTRPARSLASFHAAQKARYGECQPRRS